MSPAPQKSKGRPPKAATSRSRGSRIGLACQPRWLQRIWERSGLAQLNCFFPLIPPQLLIAESITETGAFWFDQISSIRQQHHIQNPWCDASCLLWCSNRLLESFIIYRTKEFRSDPEFILKFLGLPFCLEKHRIRDKKRGNQILNDHNGIWTWPGLT